MNRRILQIVSCAARSNPGLYSFLSGGGEVPAAELNSLGRNVPTTGHEISEMEFAEFVDDVVTKYFPKRLAIYDAYGQIQGSDGNCHRQECHARLHSILK